MSKIHKHDLFLKYSTLFVKNTKNYKLFCRLKFIALTRNISHTFDRIHLYDKKLFDYRTHFSNITN